jgi:hypothetical protein
MRKLLTLFAIIGLLWASAASAQMSMMGVSNGPSSGGGGCTTSTFAQDGTNVGANSGSSNTLTSPSLSTTFCNDLVVVLAGNDANGVSTVVDTQGHLTFTKHVAEGGSSDMEIWTAPLSGAPLTGDTITVTWFGGVTFINMAVVAFSGYKTSAPFDPNAAIPNISTTGACSWTTTNANDILIGRSFTNSNTPDAGWSLIHTATNSFFFGEYKSVSATQSGTTAASISGSGGSVCTAIQKGP